MNDIIIERYWYDDEKDITYTIRFIKVNDVWYAVLKDICDAVGLKSWHVAQRVKPKFLLKRNIPEDTSFETRSPISGKHRNGYLMTLVSEQGIYEVFDGGRKLKARKFAEWWTEMVMKLRQSIGLEAFQVMDMLKPEVQEHISNQLDRFLPEFDPYGDDIYYDEETGKLMKSVTLPGGDVEQVGYDGNDYQVIHY